MKAYVIRYFDTYEFIITVIAKDKKEMNQKFNNYVENGEYKLIELLHETEVIL